jgi:endogenous inhibitor of DNA gyrase (YacG/DUF329 family)
MVDLGNWLNETYRIPVAAEHASADADEQALS